MVPWEEGVLDGIDAELGQTSLLTPQPPSGLELSPCGWPCCNSAEKDMMGREKDSPEGRKGRFGGDCVDLKAMSLSPGSPPTLFHLCF